MQAREMKQLMTMACRLTPSRRQTVVSSLASGVAHCEALELVQGRLGQAPSCPKCRGAKVVRNGQADGLPRYKCRGCGVSFNALTGTPLARLRHRDKWMLQSQALDQGLSVRKAAARMGVHRTTSFRWRHRFLTLPRDVKQRALSGVAEADETYVLRSFKGQSGGGNECGPGPAPPRRQGTPTWALARAGSDPGGAQPRRPDHRQRAGACRQGQRQPGAAHRRGTRRCAVHRRQQLPGGGGQGAEPGAPARGRAKWPACPRRLAYPETSTRTTGGSRNGCAASRASPLSTCPTTSAGSERSTATPNLVPSPRRCWHWPSAHRAVIS